MYTIYNTICITLYNTYNNDILDCITLNNLFLSQLTFGWFTFDGFPFSKKVKIFKFDQKRTYSTYKHKHIDTVNHLPIVS